MFPWEKNILISYILLIEICMASITFDLKTQFIEQFSNKECLQMPIPID